MSREGGWADGWLGVWKGWKGGITNFDIRKWAKENVDEVDV